MDAFERAQRHYEREFEKERKRQERDAARHRKEMERLNKSISKAVTKLDTSVYELQAKTDAYNREIDLDLSSNRTVREVCYDFKQAFINEISFYNGRNTAYGWDKLSEICSNGTTVINSIHLSGKDSVETFENAMKAIGFRVIVKINNDGPRDQKNLAGFIYDGKGQLTIPTVKAAASKPAKTENKVETPKLAAIKATAARLASTKGGLTVGAFTEAFKKQFGAVLRIYNGRSKADDGISLQEVGLTQEINTTFDGKQTVGALIEQMAKAGLKVKVYTCDEWVAVLDGLTLEQAGKIKKNATKADMESIIACKRQDKNLQGYTIEVREDGGYTVKKDGVECDNTKTAMREIAGLIGLKYDASWTTRQFGSKLIGFLNNK